MKLRKLKIKNFRGIGSAEIDIEDFTSFIGPNNIGKSTILHALNILLDNKKPTVDDWPNKSPSAEVMEIICEFRDLEDWEKKKPAISGLLHEDRLIIRLSASWNSALDTLQSEYSVYCTIDELPWSNFKEAKKNEESRSCLELLEINNVEEFKAKRAELEAMFKDKYHRLCGDDNGLARKEVSKLSSASCSSCYVRSGVL